MKVRVWTYTADGGDGSAYPAFFATEEEASKYGKRYEELTGSGWGEDVVTNYDLEFDNNGVLLNPSKVEDLD